MMSKLTVFSVFILIIGLFSGCAKNDVDDIVTWQRAFGYDDFDAVYSVMATVDGKYVLAGETKSKGGKADILLFPGSGLGRRCDIFPNFLPCLRVLSHQCF